MGTSKMFNCKTAYLTLILKKVAYGYDSTDDDDADINDDRQHFPCSSSAAGTYDHMTSNAIDETKTSPSPTAPTRSAKATVIDVCDKASFSFNLRRQVCIYVFNCALCHFLR